MCSFSSSIVDFIHGLVKQPLELQSVATSNGTCPHLIPLLPARTPHRHYPPGAHTLPDGIDTHLGSIQGRLRTVGLSLPWEDSSRVW